MDLLRNIDIATVAIQFVVLLFSLSIHEASHAWMADRLGDYTARYLGRVTLNPVSHIDPIGTILFPMLMLFAHIPLIGWAKPVPVNPAHLRNPRQDNVYISLAGPAANLLAGTSAFVILMLLKTFNPGLMEAFFFGSREPASIATPIIELLYSMFFINFALALFNCIPIPPLDGHWVLYKILPNNALPVLERLRVYGFLVLYALMFLGILQIVFIPVRFLSGLLIHF
jgi:Zn-dependent protease